MINVNYRIGLVGFINLNGNKTYTADTACVKERKSELKEKTHETEQYGMQRCRGNAKPFAKGEESRGTTKWRFTKKSSKPTRSGSCLL